MAKDPREYGFEGEMAMSQLKGIMQHAKQLHGMLKPDTDLPEWVQSKITLAYDYMQTAADYMATEMSEEVQIDELSSDTLKSYKTKAFADARSTDDDSRFRKRMTGAHKASSKVSKREMDSSYKEDLPNMLKDLRSKKKSHANMRREYGSSWKRLQNRTAAEHGYDYNRDHLLQVGQKHMNEDVDTYAAALIKRNKQNLNKGHVVNAARIAGMDDKKLMAAVNKKVGRIKEEAPANSVGGGKIAGMGVGAQGEPGVGPKAMKRYKDKNAAAAPKAGRKAFSIFMQGK